MGQNCTYVLPTPAIPFSNDDYSKYSQKYAGEIELYLEKDIAGLPSKNLKDYKQAYQRRSEFILGLVKEEHFLVEDGLTEKLNELVVKILDANEIREKERLRFLISRSGIPNAFTTGDGTIVVNLGLISRLQNWEQLAFVFCHELAHHQMNHVNESIDKRITLTNSDEFKKKVKASKRGEIRANQELTSFLEDNVLSFAQHSRNAELETDALGFDLFLKAGFDKSNAISLLRILDEIDEPKYELPSLDSVFNFPSYPWKPEWGVSHLSGLSLVKLSKEEQEKYSTHPQIEERLEQLIEKGAEVKEGIPVEICEDTPIYDLEILEHYYEGYKEFEAFILGLQLAQLNPKNEYVQAVVGNCLVEFSLARKEHRYSNLVPLPGRLLNETENAVATFLDNLSLTDLKEISNAYIERHGLLNHDDDLSVELKNKLKQLKEKK